MFRNTFMASLVALTALASVTANAELKRLDNVAVIVNDGVILEGEIKSIVADVRAKAALANQVLPSDKALRAQAIDKLVLTSIQLQMAERMGIQISDAHLDSVLQSIAERQNISVDEFRQQLESTGENFERYREELRNEIALNEVVRANVRRRVNVSEQEIDTLVKIIEQQTSKEEYQIGHILIAVDSNATQAEVEERRDVADKVIELLNEGSDFKQVAIASSSGIKALEGGDWGYMSVNEMPSLFSENVKGQPKDSLVGPLRSGAGFHIVKILDVRGRETVEIKEVNARHILLTPSIILSEEKAKNMLNQFVSDVKEGKADFAELAKEHSEDPGSALRGGDLGWANPDVYAPNFKDTIAELKIGEFSAPFRTQFGWHVVQLMDTRKADTTEKTKKDRAYQIIFKRKFAEEQESWLREIREQAFIEVITG
ncbi:peptidylprolyl isomerase SurA [Psychrosphaera aestuarii]|uniref:peptidylprolyl isomerase SurA n=1 Tax=Psychrosphaera aestuarii TaxID=1266052 RepID=UPI001FD4B86F|nr:peptidylprolyl isomerase SurA [Psychrosphaera aestuarii]